MKEKSTGNPTHQKQAFWFPALLLALFLLPTAMLNAQTATPPAAGDGTMANPWQIATLDNLYWLSQTTTEWVADKYFIQTADIDAANTSTWSSGAGFSPVGTAALPFYGNYDGDSKTISNLHINRPTLADVGLFGYVGNPNLPYSQVQTVIKKEKFLIAIQVVLLAAPLQPAPELAGLQDIRKTAELTFAIQLPL